MDSSYDSERTSTMEVPLVFPSLAADDTPCFVVHDVDGEVLPPGLGRLSRERFLTSSDDKSLLRGGASVSTLQRPGRTKLIVTTNFLLETPWILSVSLLELREPHNTEPQILYLDLSQTKVYKDTAFVQAFWDDERQCIPLILVDRNAVILKFTLQLSSEIQDNSQNGRLIPSRRVTLVNVAGHQALGSPSTNDSALLDPDLASLVPPDCIRPNMVAALSSRRIVLALNPMLLCVEIHDSDNDMRDRTATYRVWSKGKCLERMKSRSSRIKKFLANSVDLLVGKNEMIQSNVIDMNPVSAVTVVSTRAANSVEEDDLDLVFTLHSDGIVRKWTLRDESSEPWSVLDLVIDGMPEPDIWSEDDPYFGGGAVSSTMLTAGLCGQRNTETQKWVLAVHMLLQRPSAASDTSTASSCCLLVVDGHVAVDAPSTNEPYVCELPPLRLEIPGAAVSLIGMAFDLAQSRCCLRALFSGGQRGILPLTYPPSHDKIVGHRPLPLEENSNEFLMEYTAWQEQKRIARSSFVHSIVPSAEALDTLDLDDALHELDTQWMRFLFRPALPRGTGSVLPPSKWHIRRALRKLARVRNGDSSFDEEDDQVASIELETLQALHEWRTIENRKMHLGFQRGGVISRVAASVPRIEASTTASSIYESVGAGPVDDNKGDVIDMDEDSESEDDEDAYYKVEQLKAHEKRWRQFLMEVYDDEEMLRMPLCLGCAPTWPDTLVLVRSGTTSVITTFTSQDNFLISPTGGQPSVPLSSLDKAAIAILRFVESDSNLSSRLIRMEQTHWEAVTSFDVVLSAPSKANIDRSLVQDLCVALNGSDVETVAESALAELRSFPDTDIMAALEQPPTFSALPGLHFLSKYQDYVQDTTDDFISEAGRQQRLAAASLTLRSVDSARRLYLGRRLLLELEKISGLQVEQTATRMYLHSLAVLWASSQRISMTSTASHISREPKSTASARSATPPSKRPSFGQNPVGILGSDETLTLDAFFLVLGQRGYQLEGSSLASTVVGMCDAATKACLNVRAVVSDGLWDALQGLPELSILSKDAVGHANLVLRLVSSFVAFPRSEEDPLVTVSRDELLAECLLIAAGSAADDRARVMADRAFELLEFDEQNLEAAMKRLEKLNDLVSGNSMLSGMLIDYVERAIQKMDPLYPEDVRKSNNKYVSLWSTLRDTAIVIRDWDKAYSACVRNPDSRRRLEGLQILSRAMVDEGDLSKLLQMCDSLSGQSTIDLYAEAVSSGVSFYGIAAEKLSESGLRDLYNFRVTQEGPPSDYQGALYALHVSQGEWRKAAQALDQVFLNGMNALGKDASELKLDAAKAREREDLIVDDLVLSSLGTFLAVSLVNDEATRFIVSGDHGRLPSFQASVGLSSKRGRGPLGISDPAEPTSDSDRISRYMNLNDLHLRAMRASSLAVLHHDSLIVPEEVKSNLLKGCRTTNMLWEFDNLCRLGYYYQSLALAKTVSMGDWLDDKAVFEREMSHLLRDYLVPLASGRDLSVPPRPTIGQLRRTLDDLSSPTPGAAPIVLGSRSKRNPDLVLTTLQATAMYLLSCLTTKFSSASTPFAKQVANWMLNDEHCESIPLWLEKLLLVGSGGSPGSGLFARRPKPGHHDYPGDPAGLLTLYMDRGMYKDACELVRKVLNSTTNTVGAQATVTRLPEKGDLDFVPYEKIDLLNGLIEVTLEDPRLDTNQKQELQESLDEMIKSVEDHLARLQISEMAIQSARALAT